MSIKKIYTEVKVPCYYRIENGSTIKHCEECTFFNGVEKDINGEIVGVDCLRSDIGQISAHVTSFTSNGYLYKSRKYDETIDGELTEDYDFCEKCCFNKKLKNGNETCLLRCGIDNDEKSNFICYEDEIWTKEKMKVE